MFPNLENERLIALDIEAHDPDIMELGPGARRKGSYILGVGVAVKGNSWYFPFTKGKNPECIDWLNSLKNAEFVGANLLYDIDFLQYQNFTPAHMHDVQLAEPLIDENAKSYSLNALSKKYLGSEKGEAELEYWCTTNKLKGKPQSHLAKMPVELVAKYCRMDCELTYDVFSKQLQELKRQDLIGVYDIERGLLPLLRHMRNIGVNIDENKLDALVPEYQKAENDAQKKLNAIAGFEVNANSARDIVTIFLARGKTYKKTDKGNPSFDKFFLTECAEEGDEIAELIMTIRDLQKTRGTFLEGLKKFIINGRIHCEFNPLRSDYNGTVSGRFSSSRPNLQQIPARNEKHKKEVRGLFIPAQGCYWAKIDYSQIELRGLAHYARGEGAEEIRKAYNANPHVDFHQICAGMIGIKRGPAKTINFGVVYGMGIAKLCTALCLDESEGRRIIADYHKKMPFLRKTSYTASDTARERGYVYTILKRRRRFPDPQFSYKALNSVIQGTAADIMKKAMVDTWNAGIYETLIPHLTVHDEMDVSVPDTPEGKEALMEMKNIMENTIALRVPLVAEIEIGPSWGETVKI